MPARCTLQPRMRWRRERRWYERWPTVHAHVRAPVSMLCMLPSTLRGGVNNAAGLDASDIADVLQGGWPAARYCSVSAQGAAPGSCVPRRGAAAACTAMVTHPAWCYRLATPKPSGGPKRGRGAAHADVPSWPRPATPARRRACSSLCRSCCARTSSQHCACRVSAAAVRFPPAVAGQVPCLLWCPRCPCQAAYARTAASQSPAKVLCFTKRWSRMAGSSARHTLAGRRSPSPSTATKPRNHSACSGCSAPSPHSVGSLPLLVPRGCRNLTGGKAWPVYVRLENGLHLGPKSCLHCLVAFIVEPVTRSGPCRAPPPTPLGLGCSPVPCVGW